MKLAYNPTKATQAVAYLVRLDGGRMGLWRMLKLVYLFDRESLVEIGSSVTGDILDNLPHGGTPSRIYDNTKSSRDPRYKDAVWLQYLTESIADEVRLQNPEFSTNELSDFERDIIKNTWEKFGKLSNKELYDFVHGLPEFKDPAGSSTHIEPEEILRHANWDDEDIRLADREAKEGMAPESNLQMKVGDAFYLPDYGGAHINFVLEILPDGSVILCNFTDYSTHFDKTCIIEIGHHPSITKRSVVNFKSADYCEVGTHLDSISRIAYNYQESVSPELLARIRQAAIDSRFTSDKIKEALRKKK